MNELFARKIENIYKNLMECYRDTEKYAPSIIGAEREIFNRELFQKILPSNYRVNAGTITDCMGKETGQIDAVIELPFSLSFPISSAENRLFLADTIGAAFEIKSNLNSKWDEAISKIKEIKKLNRYYMKEGEMVLLDNLKIPSYIIAFTGPKKVDTILEKFTGIQVKDRPDGIWVIEHGTFYGRIPGGNSVFEVHNPRRAVLAFISCIYQTLQNYSKNTADLDIYQNLL